MTFDEVWKGRVVAAFDPEPISVIGLAELRKNKRASGRPKDLADVARLTELHGARHAKRRKPAQKSKPGTRKTRRRRP